MDDDAEQLHETSDLVAMPYSSQAGGFFSNRLQGDEAKRLKAEQSGYATNTNLRIATIAGDIAQRNGVSVGAVVLAFLRAHPFKVVPIVGCGTPEHLGASIESLDFTLSDSDWNNLVELTRSNDGWFSRHLWKRQ
jgi:aryl-alcohol dehydrogenase-like predicted oxidoreductase